MRSEEKTTTPNETQDAHSLAKESLPGLGHVGATHPGRSPARDPYGSARRGAQASFPRGVVVLYSQIEGPGTGEPDEIEADIETETTARGVVQVLQEHTPYEVHLLPASLPIEPRLAPFPPQDYLVFNLFEGLTGQSSDEACAAFTLQALGYHFTGARGHVLKLADSKAETARVLANKGILTPPGRLFRHPDEVTASGLQGLSFPLFVKPVAEDGSVGIDQHAVVTDLDSLRNRVAHVVELYREPALVSAFIDGREFNVAVWGDPLEVLPLSEIDFGAIADPHARIVSFAGKWDQTSLDYIHTPVVCPAQVSDSLAARIRHTALAVWTALDCSGYARVDLRSQGQEVYVLELNPNPSLAPDAGFARSARVAGLDYAQMILKIVSFI